MTNIDAATIVAGGRTIVVPVRGLIRAERISETAACQSIIDSITQLVKFDDVPGDGSYVLAGGVYHPIDITRIGELRAPFVPPAVDMTSPSADIDVLYGYALAASNSTHKRTYITVRASSAVMEWFRGIGFVIRLKKSDGDNRRFTVHIKGGSDFSSIADMVRNHTPVNIYNVYAGILAGSTPVASLGSDERSYRSSREAVDYLRSSGFALSDDSGLPRVTEHLILPGTPEAIFVDGRLIWNKTFINNIIGLVPVADIIDISQHAFGEFVVVGISLDSKGRQHLSSTRYSKLFDITAIGAELVDAFTTMKREVRSSVIAVKDIVADPSGFRIDGSTITSVSTSIVRSPALSGDEVKVPANRATAGDDVIAHLGDDLAREVIVEFLRDNDVVLGNRLWWQCSVDKSHIWQTTASNRLYGNTGCPDCSRSKQRKKFTGSTLLGTYPHVAAEWHPTKNPGLSPSLVTPKSSKKVWWQCAAKGHEWEASVNKRSSGQSCPVCQNRLIVPGINDLATLNPELAAEWDSEKNPFSASTVPTKSSKKVFWKCRHGHSWEAVIAKRSSGQGCPECLRLGLRERALKGSRSLLDARPDIADEWDSKGNVLFGTNMSLTAADSRIMLSWVCPKGHSFKATASSRASGSNCPYCSGRKVDETNSLAAMEPDIAAEVDEAVHGEGFAKTIHSGSKKNIAWRCRSCSNSWVASPSSRTGTYRSGCPACSGRVANNTSRLSALAPQLAAEYGSSNTKPVKEVSANSHDIVSWLCAEGHEWEDQVKKRFRTGSGCPMCNGGKSGVSRIETEVYEFVLSLCADAVQSDKLAIGRELDIYVPSLKLAIEVDGKRFHSDQARRVSDAAKNELASSHGIELIRISDVEWLSSREQWEKLIQESVSHRRLRERADVLAEALGEGGAK